MESNGAADIFLLQEKGVPLVETQADLTPFQRQVLLEQHKRIEEEKQQQIEESKDGGSPSGMKRMSGGKPNSRSNKINAIKESQEDQDKFINKSVINND